MSFWGTLAPSLTNATNRALSTQPWLGLPVAFTKIPNSDEAIRRSMDLALATPAVGMPLSMAIPEGTGSLGVFAGRMAGKRLAERRIT